METQNYIEQISGASLVILEKGEVNVLNLGRRSEWLIGRYHPDMPNAPDIPLSSMIVSKTHGWFRNIDS